MREPQLNLWKLEVFCKVIEERSFSGAARALSISQPTVSSHIAALEKAIGARLFDRIDGDVSVTPVGSILDEEARQLLESHRQAFQRVSDFLGVVRGTLRVGGSTIPGNYILPTYVLGFREQHPGIDVEIRCANSRAVMDAIDAGQVEVAVIGEKPPAERFRSWAFEGDEIVLATPPDHPFAGGPEIPLARLEEESHILREPGSGTRALCERLLMRKGFALASRAPIVCHVGSSEGIRQAVLAGIGVAFVSERAIVEEVVGGRLAAVRIEGLEMKRRFYLCHSARRSVSPIGRNFVAHLRRTAPRKKG